MKPLRFIFTFLLIGLFVSCTENDEPLPLSKLTLTYNVQTTNVPVHKTIQFSLIGNDYVDYTTEMTLKVNGQPVEGSSYTVTEVGDVEVQAFANNMSSNVVTFSVLEGLTIDRKSLLKNQVATFTLYDVSTGDDITDLGTFYIDDAPIAGNTFSSTTPGTYEVYAQYVDVNGETQVTDTDTISVVTPTQRALIEDYTGTWCGYCPQLQGVISDLMALTDDAVVVAIHASSSDINPDPYEYEHIEQLVDEYNPYGVFPMGRINRTVQWNDKDPQTAMQYVGGESSMGIAATTKVNGTQLTVEVRVASTQGLSNRKIVVAVLENDLFHDQKNYLNENPSSRWYQAGNPILNYENDHVLRHAMTNIFGDPIPTTAALQDFRGTYTMDLGSYLNVPENAEIVIFVMDNAGTVLQAKQIGLNEHIGFE